MDFLQSVKEWRAVSIFFILASCFLANNIADWYMSVSIPNNSQSGFVSASMLALIGVGKVWMETKACSDCKTNNELLHTFRNYRLVTLAYIVYCMYLSSNMITWYTALEEPTTGQGAASTAIVGTLVGVVTYWMKTKHNGGQE